MDILAKVLFIFVALLFLCKVRMWEEGAYNKPGKIDGSAAVVSSSLSTTKEVK